MKKMTGENLKNAYAGESQAHMRYAIYADVAEKEGMPDIARLFRSISYAELVHATNHYRELDMIKSTAENLQVAIDGEDYEVEEMYPAFKKVAELQGQEGAVTSFHYAEQAEQIHSKMYREAREHAEAGKDIDLDKVYVCPICGYTHQGEPPEYCPVCGAAKDKFKSF